MKFAVNSEVPHKCQAILGIRLFMKNVAAQVALQTVWEEKGAEQTELGREDPTAQKW